MRALSTALLLLTACAFPPNADTGENPCKEMSCAGRCEKGVCVPAAVGESCDPSGEGPACESNANCVHRVCRPMSCTGDPCLCPGAPRCAGRCALGICIGARPGESCDPSGSGPACVEGACVEGRCTLPSEPVPLTSWRETFARARCGWLLSCHHWPESLADACPDFVAPASSSFGSVAADVLSAQQGDASYDADEAGDCVAGYAARDCFGAEPDACGRVFGGAASRGETCRTDAACEPGLWCQRTDPTGLSCGGVCEPRVDEGGSCSVAPCLEGLDCLTEAAGDVCRVRAAPGEVGDPCASAFGSCGRGLFCDVTGRCAPRAKEGEACDQWSGCEDGLACAVLASSRAECLPVRGVGQPCVSHQQCSPGHALVADAACVDGLCRKLPQWGACAGDGLMANRCDPTVAWCDNQGECRPRRQTGDGCLSSTECGVLSEDVCSFGSCQSPEACEP